MHRTRRDMLGFLVAVSPAMGVAPSGRDFANAPFVHQAAAGAYVHFGQIALATPANQGDIANLAAIIGDDSVAVVDTGGSVAVGHRLLAAIRRVTAKPISYVINTHEHPDHVFGNAAFDDTNAIFVGHHMLPRSLAERGSYYLRSYKHQLSTAEIAKIRIIPPTLLVQDRMILDLGGRPLTLVAHGPAHSDCDLTVLDESSGTLFSGDLVFLQHVPVLDGSLRGWLESLAALASVPAQHVLPGHGRLLATWPQGLDDVRRYLHVIASDAERLIHQGMPLAQAVDQIGASERGHWELFEAYNGRNATAAFTELEWG